MTAKVKARLFVEDELAPGLVPALAGAPAHYLRNVLRAERGDEVLLFNGRQGEWLGRIEAIAKADVRVKLVRESRAQSSGADLWLLFAPIKRARVDFVVEKATELGVSALWPVFTRHTQMARINLDRLKATAIEAAEQSERLTIPDIIEPASLTDAIGGWPGRRRLVVCAERGPAAPIGEAFANIDGPAAILIGPEGGFADGELDDLAKLDFVSRVGLGPRILRADTAAVAALSIWQALAGDWRGSSSVRPR